MAPDVAHQLLAGERIRPLLDENHRLRGESDGLRAELALAYGERRDAGRDS